MSWEVVIVNRRLLLSLLGGGVAALICLAGAFALGFMRELSLNTASLVLNRIVIGLVIGISCWRINYLLHGAIIGLIISLLKSINFLPLEPIGFLAFTMSGVAYGIAIEFVATKLCREPA